MFLKQRGLGGGGGKQDCLHSAHTYITPTDAVNVVNLFRCRGKKLCAVYAFLNMIQGLCRYVTFKKEIQNTEMAKKVASFYVNRMLYPISRTLKMYCLIPFQNDVFVVCAQMCNISNNQCCESGSRSVCF
jgi:hypothetical protein